MLWNRVIANKFTQRKSTRRDRRPRHCILYCPNHPVQHTQSNRRKSVLHLLSPEKLQRQGMTSKQARLVISSFPVLVLSNEWMEELLCPKCGISRWCHITKQNLVEHRVR